MKAILNLLSITYSYCNGIVSIDPKYLVSSCLTLFTEILDQKYV